MLLYSKIFGKGNDFVILHGLFGNGNNWISFAKKIAKNFQVHLLDIRNHGYSFFTDEMDLDLMSKDLLNYINYHKLKNPILLGHSLGGKILMHFSMQFPFFTKKLIIVDIAPKLYKKNNQKELISILNKVNFNVIKTRNELSCFLKTHIKDIKIIEFFSKNVEKQKNGKLCFRFFLSGIEKNYDNFMFQNMKNKIYNGSVLFIRGEKSDYISLNDFSSIKKFFPKAIIKTIKNASHWVHIDNPKDFYNIIHGTVLQE
ncbi:alpha/beta fold hydrolase [Blattabacterium cuenoti]|uniref:alpha/beta fold hydrolase n=1 Tax=Blattabacterium cuenoti TaxID=1653831 RepID=UPI00163CA29B|nr:alpha/beta fold hydrolase [Blattabacterium cuenoti]